MIAASATILADVQRDMQTLASYLVEADVALTKAVEHVMERAPGTSPLILHLTKLRDATRAAASTLSSETTRLLGPPQVNA